MQEINWFKSKRRYIQAADLVGVAVSQVQACEHFDFASRKMADHPARWVEAGSVDKQLVLATFKAQSAAGAIDWVAVQDESRDIERFDEFAEELMFAVSTVSDGVLTATIVDGFSVWEHISSLNKLLLGKVFDHPSWWFVRLEGNAALLRQPVRDIQIRYLEKKRILYRSEIHINGEYFGTVDYAMR